MIHTAEEALQKAVKFKMLNLGIDLTSYKEIETYVDISDLYFNEYNKLINAGKTFKEVVELITITSYKLEGEAFFNHPKLIISGYIKSTRNTLLCFDATIRYKRKTITTNI